jgi:UDP-N-acetylmuramoyl-tripeptide--D-alanyl-D-alanine ligase
MRAALANLLERADGHRTVAILGEMAELGADAPRYHEEVGREAAAVDVVLGVGELARLYQPDEWAPTAADAREAALALVRPGDAILVKGSRSVGLEVVGAALLGDRA